MATPQINEETILKRYESLPDDLKEALMGVSTADALYDIGRKANLNVEKIGALAEEVGLIILGFTPSANFISDLKTALGVNEEKASEIAGQVNERVFLPIRESLKRLHGASWGEGLVKPPTKFEGQKVAEVKPRVPLPEIKPDRAGGPEAKPLPPTPKEPLLIRPMGVAGAAPKEELKGVTEIPRPGPPPPSPAAPRPPLPTPPPAVVAPRPVTPPTPPPIPTAEKKPLEIRPPGIPAAEEKKPPLVTPPKHVMPSPPPIKPQAAEIKPPEIKLPLKPPLEIKIEVKPAPEAKPELKLPPTPPPPTPQPPKPVTPPPAPAPTTMPKPSTPPSPPKPPEMRPGYDPYRESVE